MTDKFPPQQQQQQQHLPQGKWTKQYAGSSVFGHINWAYAMFFVQVFYSLFTLSFLLYDFCACFGHC